MPARVHVAIGTRYDMLVVLSEAMELNGKRRFICRCNCGSKPKIVHMSALRSKLTRSCGCYGKSYHITHGQSATPLYVVRKGMISRCHSKNAKDYPDYGGRGIRVCDEWCDPVTGVDNFASWNASLPPDRQWRKGLTIDRIDNDGDYEPDNCEWSDWGTQVLHKRNTLMCIFRGKITPLRTAFDILTREGRIDLLWGTVKKRFQKGSPAGECFGPKLR